VDNEPPLREAWLSLVLAGIRSKFGVTAFVLMGAAATWQLASGHVRVGLIIAAIIVWTFAKISFLIVAAITLPGIRRRERAKRYGSPVHSSESLPPLRAPYTTAPLDRSHCQYSADPENVAVTGFRSTLPAAP